MTPQMEEFLKEFAELLEKHEIEFEISETGSDYHMYCDGIYVFQNRVYNHKLDRTEMEFCEMNLPREFDSIDIKGFIKENR